MNGLRQGRAEENRICEGKDLPLYGQLREGGDQLLCN
jgi:hypothetical protein